MIITLNLYPKSSYEPQTYNITQHGIGLSLHYNMV